MKVFINVKKLFFFLLALLSLSGCSSSSNYFGYEKFKCKGKTVTSYYPLKLYTFKNADNEDFYFKMTQYSMNPIDFGTNLSGDNHINIVKLYPAFEKLKLLKYYVHCSFGNGCYDDYLVENQDGVISWLSGANLSSNTCQISGSDFWLDTEQNATDSYNAEAIDRPYTQSPIKENTVNYSNYSGKIFIEQFVRENNMKLKYQKNDDSLTIILPTNKIYKLSVFIYVEKVLKNFYPKNIKLYMKLIFKDVSHPIFEYSMNQNTYSKTPFNCKRVSIESPFGCYEHLDKWLKKPYEYNMTELIGNTKYNFTKQKLHVFAIFDYEFLDIGMYFDNMRYLQELKDVDLKIYSADIGYRGFSREGIYLVDNNFTIINQLYFNKESIDKISNIKDLIETTK